MGEKQIQKFTLLEEKRKVIATFVKGPNQNNISSSFCMFLHRHTNRRRWKIELSEMDMDTKLDCLLGDR